MRHSVSCRVFTFAVSIVLTGSLSGTAAGQSVWQKIKDAAKQGAQQGQQPSQQPRPQQPGQQRPGQRSASPSQQAPGQDTNAGPIHPPAGTKIEEKILAPLQERASFSVSPHGVHVATVENAGGRAVVYYDGEMGPKFDEIIPQPTGTNTRVVFSPDGNRYAYCARAGDQYVAMVDGKELVRSSESNDGRFDGESCHLAFTPNNKHFFWTSLVRQGTQRGQTFKRFWFDGKPSPTGSVEGVAFSPDGDHYAYVLTISDPYHEDRYALIIDGKQAPYTAGAPQWSADSKHLYSQMRVSLGPKNGQGYDLLLDGKPIARAFGYQLYIPPVGDMAIAIVHAGVNFKPVDSLAINGRKVPGSDIAGPDGAIEQVVISPDGKHFAALYRYQSVKRWLLVDGKKQLEYQNITKIAFTADSSKVVYQAMSNGKSFIVLGDQESDAYSNLSPDYVLAPAGNRVASLVQGDNYAAWLFLDGRTIRPGLKGIGQISFTPDGTHYGYVALDAGAGQRLSIDGVVQPQSNLGGIAGGNLGKFIFSSDSKHVAHFAYPPQPTGDDQRGLFLDGKYIPTGHAVNTNQLMFSGDNKHLAWVQQVPSTYDFRVVIDGKPIVQAEATANNTINNTEQNWIEFQPDGTLLVLAQDANSLKRISITPAPDSGIAQVSGNGTNVASRN